MYDRKNNPDLNRSDGESITDYLSRVHEQFSKLEWQSEGHRMWYTHKNPYSCWICELLQVGRALEDELVALGLTDTSREQDNTGTE